MAQNRNPRWRPSLNCCIIIYDHSRSLFVGPHQLVKFYANPIHNRENITIWFFCRFGLKCLFRPPKFRFFGVSTPKRHWSSTRPPKGTSMAWTALTRRFWWRSVQWYDLGAKEPKRKQGKKLTVANWVLAQTTHVDAAICGGLWDVVLSFMFRQIGWTIYEM